MKPSRKSVSISDIARACNVSAMTVSRALRPDAVIKSATREHILEIAARLGYLRNSRLGRPAAEPGRNLPKIQLIIGGSPRKMVQFHASLIAALEREITAAGCECILFCSDGDAQGFLRVLETAKRTLAHATIIAGDFADQELRALLLNFPGAVVLDNPGLTAEDCTFSSIGFDNKAAAVSAMEHLLGLNRRNIILITGVPEHFFSREILAGYCAALEQRRLPVRPELIRHTDFTAPGAEAAIDDLLERHIDFDAVFTNDEMAAGVYRSLQRHTIAIPRQVAVVGCDDLPLGKLLYPALTTVKLDYTLLAREALDCITRKEAGFQPIHRRLAPELIVRQSTW